MNISDYYLSHLNYDFESKCVNNATCLKNYVTDLDVHALSFVHL